MVIPKIVKKTENGPDGSWKIMILYTELEYIIEK